MYLFTYSYKVDSLDEVIGTVKAESLEDAIEMICRIKQISKQSVIDLFNIRKVTV